MREKILSTLVASVALATAFVSNAQAQTAPQLPAPAAPAPAAPPAPASATAAFPSPVPAAAPQPQAVLPAVEAHRTARVRFNANEPGAMLESDTTSEGKQSPWYVVCEAPCAATVSKSGAFRVSGSGFHPSRLFRLPIERDDVKVDAEMEHSSVAVPMALAIVGGVIASVGGLMTLSAIAAEENNRDGEELLVPGAIIGGAGTVIATIGVVMLLVKAQHGESKAHVAERAHGIVF